MSQTYLQNLNDAQLRAVQHPPDVPLQILAGPGSGKTRVLTTRIAHLIFQHCISPDAICAVTFTNKAAREMRERLTTLVGEHDTSKIRMGTFHALCATFLRRDGKLVGIKVNFTVCDMDESTKIMRKLLAARKNDLAKENITLHEGAVVSMISKAKARGQTADDLESLRASQQSRQKSRTDQQTTNKHSVESQSQTHDDVDVVVLDIYKEYEKTLRKNNSLDFDDLLLYGVRLFSQHSSVGKWCKHVLVDEFQDTNMIQYDLMRHMASSNGCVTIVGDPDQSIYGWRSAEAENLHRMQRDFPGTQQIHLEQNYRSTASILAASMSIVSQDTKRVAKTLRATYPTGPRPVLLSFASAQQEAAFISTEIKRLVAATGGMLVWNDFAILLRFNDLSRQVERALQSEGVPNRVLAGHKFFERLEVKDVLAYLQLVDNPDYLPAFVRIVNVPARLIGEKTVAELLSTAERLELSPLEVVKRIHGGDIPDIKPPVRRKLASFLLVINDLCKLAQEGTTPSNLIRHLLERIQYKAHLSKTQPDWESRWGNVQELISFASEVEGQAEITSPSSDDELEEGEWGAAEEFAHDLLGHEGFIEVDKQATSKGKGKAVAGRSPTRTHTPLRRFLQASMLSTDVQSEDNNEGKGKVTITTCHAAKGLEWPVVFVPAVEKGTFPSHRAEDADEERRLLYVACTRAQALLYLTHSAQRMVAGEMKRKQPSEFVITALSNNQTCFASSAPDLTARDRAMIAQLLGRTPPAESEVVRVGERLSRARNEPWNGEHPREACSNHSAFQTASGAPVNLAPFRGSTQSFSTKGSLTDKCGMQNTRSGREPSGPPLSPIRGAVVNVPSQQVPPRSRSSVVPTASKTVFTFPRGNLAPGRTFVKEPAAANTPLFAQGLDTRPPNGSADAHSPPESSPDPPLSSGSALSDSPAVELVRGKRRLGMGRTAAGYTNKKFKAPGMG